MTVTARPVGLHIIVNLLDIQGNKVGTSYENRDISVFHAATYFFGDVPSKMSTVPRKLDHLTSG